jgi:hypothetical protein
MKESVLFSWTKFLCVLIGTWSIDMNVDSIILYLCAIIAGLIKIVYNVGRDKKFLEIKDEHRGGGGGEGV